MITRLSHNPWLDPRYMIAMGNQTDLTHGDLLSWFAARDGTSTASASTSRASATRRLWPSPAVRRAVLAGKQVVVQVGRSEAGQGGVMGHTASIAGDPVLFARCSRRPAPPSPTTSRSSTTSSTWPARCTPSASAATASLQRAAPASRRSAPRTQASADLSCAWPRSGRHRRPHRGGCWPRRSSPPWSSAQPARHEPGADDDAHVRITAAMVDDPGGRRGRDRPDHRPHGACTRTEPPAPGLRPLRTRSTVHTLPPLVAHRQSRSSRSSTGRPTTPAAAGLMDRGVRLPATSRAAPAHLVRRRGAPRRRAHPQAFRRDRDRAPPSHRLPDHQHPGTRQTETDDERNLRRPQPHLQVRYRHRPHDRLLRATNAASIPPALLYDIEVCCRDLLLRAHRRR